jgi:hypothetical protein
MHKAKRSGLILVLLGILLAGGLLIYNANQPTPIDGLEKHIEEIYGSFDVLTIGIGENDTGTMAMMAVACLPREECLDIPMAINNHLMVEAINGMIELIPDKDNYVVYFSGRVQDKWVTGAGLRCPYKEGGYDIIEIQAQCSLVRFPTPISLPPEMTDRAND